jgi:glycosyltransferase involved in cell wall biosynthesis
MASTSILQRHPVSPRPVDADCVWIVVAAYNEAARLPATLRSLRSAYANVVVVDDGSRDNTFLAARDQGAWALRHIVNCGQGAALQTGIDFALERGAEVIVTFDADGQHAVDDVKRLLTPIFAGQVEVVLGSRFLGASPNIPWSRWLVLKLGVLFTRVVSRIGVTDTHNGLRALSRRAATRLRITENRMAHASELLEQVRRYEISFCEVPVTIRYSPTSMAKGQSSWNSLRIAAQFLLGKVVR